MEPDLSNYFNHGLVPPPIFDWEPPRLRKPAWQPTRAQADAARWQLMIGSILLAVLTFVFLFLALSGRI